VRDGAKAAGLVADVQKVAEARKDKGLKTFVVVMGGPETKGSIDKLAAAQKVTIPVTFLPKGPGAGDIGYYKINPAAENTILLWKGQRVQQSFVDVDHAALPAVEKAVDELLK
jgi:hypothetical protein